MVQARKKRKDKKKLAASHNKSWIWGRHAVLEILEAGRWPIHELYLSDSLDTNALNHVRDLAETLDVRIKMDPSDRLRELSRTSEHQGYLAKMKPFPYAPSETLNDLIHDQSTSPVIAILDQIQDPHNLGAIIRSAEVLGINAIIIGTTNQVDITPTVARASAGAVNHIPIIQTDDLSKTIEDLKQNNVLLIAATEKGTPIDTQNSLRKNNTSCALLLGNEGKGISQELLSLCDKQVQIPQHGKIQSLNVAAAATILFYETTR